MKVFAFALIAVVFVAFVAAEEAKPELAQDKPELAKDDKLTEPITSDGKTQKAKPLGKPSTDDKIKNFEEDALTKAINQCLDNLDLTDVDDITQEENYCLIGCLLHAFNLIDDEGKLPEGSVEKFVKSIPSKYTDDLPNLAKDMTAILPELEKAKNSCEAGKIAYKVVGELFRTEFF